MHVGYTSKESVFAFIVLHSNETSYAHRFVLLFEKSNETHRYRRFHHRHISSVVVVGDTFS